MPIIVISSTKPSHKIINLYIYDQDPSVKMINHNYSWQPKQSLTVGSGLCNKTHACVYLQLVGCESRAPFVEQDQQLWGHT